MAFVKSAEKPSDKTNVPAMVGEQVPDYLRTQVAESTGKGVSTDASDNLVPLIYILDAKSPQCDQNEAAYMPGARAGTIWLRNFSRPLVDGNEGILFQPCHF